MKIWGTKTCSLQSFVKHCRVRAFEKINIVLNALLVALGLLQAELQVLQTHFKLFLCLQIKMLVLTSRMNSVQPRHGQRSLPSPHTGKRETYLVLALAKKSQLVVPSALLCFQLQDFILKGLFSGNSLVFYPVDLNKSKINWENPSVLCLKQVRTCV